MLDAECGTLQVFLPIIMRRLIERLVCWLSAAISLAKVRNMLAGKSRKLRGFLGRVDVVQRVPPAPEQVAAKRAGVTRCPGRRETEAWKLRRKILRQLVERATNESSFPHKKALVGCYGESWPKAHEAFRRRSGPARAGDPSTLGARLSLFPSPQRRRPG